MSKEIIQSVPTNIITGFLGVGKTSAILQLLKNKPADERWAVLVNEFGEIGIDGSLLSAQHSQDEGVFIREVPGGCMCCAAGLPMQIALNQLLQKAKPDRLLIEPTGLGHPKEILRVLSAEHYQKVLCLQKTLTLVDARNLKDTRYSQHETFNQQIAIADTVVGNKVDLYQEEDKLRLTDYVKQQGKPGVAVIFSEQGKIDYLQLVGNSALTASSVHHHHHPEKRVLASEVSIPECGFIKAVNKGEGFNSIGWRFSSEIIFKHSQLFAFLSSLKVQRVKAIFITDKGVFTYNGTTESLTEIESNETQESRIEIISPELDILFEAQLMGCYATI